MTKSATATPGVVLGQVSTVKMDGSLEEMARTGRGGGHAGHFKGHDLLHGQRPQH